MNKKYFITFSAGNTNYYEASDRLIKQANNLCIFDKIISYTDDYLKNDNIFWRQHKNFIENNKKGYGYWIWKSYIIKKTMEQLEDGDVLLYADCGCEIDIRKKDKIINYMELVKTEYIIGSKTALEKEYNKMDLILLLNILENKYLDTSQHQAGALLFLICEETRILINLWYDLCCDYHNIDDSPSRSQNLDCFIDHRHDQSVFSLLTKKYQLYSTNYSIEDCIEYIRNKSGNSQINISNVTNPR